MDYTHRPPRRLRSIHGRRLLRQWYPRSIYSPEPGPSDLQPVTRRVTQTGPSAVAVTTTPLASRLSTAQQSRPRRRLQDAGLVCQRPLLQMRRSLVPAVLQVPGRQVRAKVKISHVGPSIMLLVRVSDSHQKALPSRKRTR
jgi:hypothetical protein